MLIAPRNLRSKWRDDWPIEASPSRPGLPQQRAVLTQCEDIVRRRKQTLTADTLNERQVSLSLPQDTNMDDRYVERTSSLSVFATGYKYGRPSPSSVWLLGVARDGFRQDLDWGPLLGKVW